MRLTIQEIVRAVRSDFPFIAPLANLKATGVSADTRTLRPGDLFIALKGERFDGHDHLARAFEQGASAAIVDSARIGSFPPSMGVLIGVDDPLVALGDVARVWRLKFSIPVIGVTGSVGKTTTKEMLAAALAPLGAVLKTDKNENNEIGVPKLLLRLTPERRAAVVEMGMRGSGQIAYLANVAKPTVGVISRIGENHIQLLGSMDAIADAKGELIDALPSDGLAVLNADDPYTSRLAKRAACRVVTYGFAPDATFRAVNAQPDDAGHGWSVRVAYVGSEGTLRVPSPSRHDVSNALSAALVTVELGVEMNKALEAVAAYQNVAMRMEVLTTPIGAEILSDCYNASPTSMRSALDTLAEAPATGRRIAFLGDMKELGDFAPDMHGRIAQHARELQVDDLYVVGATFGKSAPWAKGAFSDSSAAAEFAKSSLPLGAGDVVLVKGSRAMAMERIVEALTDAL